MATTVFGYRIERDDNRWQRVVSDLEAVIGRVRKVDNGWIFSGPQVWPPRQPWVWPSRQIAVLELIDENKQAGLVEAPAEEREIATTRDPVDNTAPALDYDVHHGFRIDGSQVQWWGSKSHARSGAKAIGWPMNSIERVWTRFQCGYALKQTHGGFLTREAYGRLADCD